MSTYEIVLPAGPINAVVRQELVASRAAARRQVKFAIDAWRAAERAVLTERRIYDMLDCLLSAGPGHVFSSGLVTEQGVFLPRCRHCRAHASSIMAKWACEGDTHRCPKPVRPDASARAVKMGSRHHVLCGLPGEMNGPFTAWTCRSGHVTDRSHSEGGVPHAMACCIAPACPWPELIGAHETEL